MTQQAPEAANQATPEGNEEQQQVNNNPAANNQEPSKAGPAESPQFKIPDAYKEKPWASKIKSEEDLYKQIDNLDALAGKKTIIPDLEKATPKEREDYFNSIRPKDKTAYKFDESVPAELKEGFSDMLFKNGIPAYQANELIKSYTAMEAKQKEVMFSEEGFVKEMETSFGKDFKVVGLEIDKLIKQNVSDADYELVNLNMPNQYAAVMYRFAENMRKAYGINDTGKMGEDKAGNNSATDVKAVRKEILGKINALVSSGKPYTHEQKQELQDQLEATYNIKKK